MKILLPCKLEDNIRDQIIKFSLYPKESQWILNNVGNTRNRMYCDISKFPDEPLCGIVDIFKQEIFKKFNINYFKHEHIYGNFIGRNLEGGNVHPHTDSLFENLHHVRINFLVQKPLEGGMPIIENQEYVIQEKQCWLNIASSWIHASTVVKGNVDRIVLSLGSYMPDSELIKLKNLLF